MNKMYAKVRGAGVDVHYEFSRVALVDELGRVVRRERLEHRDREALRRHLGSWPKEMTTVLEASFGWGWLSDEMELAGLDVRLSNCHKVEHMRKARGLVKTNDKDAALLALLPQESSNWWEVWRAPQDVRDRREWMRHRADLVMIQTQTKCRIHAIFHRCGIYHNFSDLFGGKGRQFLSALSRNEDPQSKYLSDGAMQALRDELLVLECLRKRLAGIAGFLRKILKRDPVVKWLKSIPGFGVILSHVVMAEVGQLERFGSAKSLASYSLLAPISCDTGEDRPGRAPLGRHLGVRGNRTLKWAFIEAAHGAVRSGGQWLELFDSVTDGRRNCRNRGYIAVARRLVNVVYAVWRDGREYRPEASAKTSQKQSRPGTGRLCHPMIAVG